MRQLARAAFFLSGVAGLTFEIVWSRYLGLAMGATTAAVATVTAAYMGGLALGSHLGGRWADRLKRPLLAYGLIEIGVAILGASIPWLSSHLSRVDALLPLVSSEGRTAIRFAVAALVLMIPTTAMGMTLPILARAVTDDVERVGREVGLLYALNIAGAVVGAGASGFWWIGAIGHVSTNMVAVGIDLTLGALACIAGLRFAALEPAPPAGDATPAVLRAGGRNLVALLALTGATAMALQVLWTRAIATALGPSTYAFTAIVCAYLCGLALGGAAASRLADRPGDPRVWLGAAMVLTGVFAFIGIAVVDDLPLLLHPVVLDTDLTPAGMVRSQFMLAAVSVLPATLGMGAIFPLTLGAVVGSKEKLGAAVGRAYAVNTIGSIAGSCAGLFLLLPLFGVEWGMRVAAIGYAVAGAWLALLPSEKPAPRTRAGLFACSAALLALVLLWPSWDVGRWTLGLFRLSMARAYFADEAPKPAEVIFHRDGMHSTVTVEEEEGIRWIKVDGKIDGSSEGDMPTQVLSGLLTSLLHPQQKNMVVVGCGSCVTVGSALLTDVERVTLVELEPAVIEGAHLFEKANHAPWNDPRLRIVEDDGRNFMRRGERLADGTYQERFDAIVSEPSNPWMTGAASLFTREFFTLAKDRLAERGLFLQWLQIYEIAEVRVHAVLKSFHEAFPYVLGFSAHRDSNDLLLIGSLTPITIDWDRLSKVFATQGKELAKADLRSPEELLALILFSERDIAALEAPLNTDDNAFVEFGAPMDMITYAEEDPEVAIVETLAGRRFALVAERTGLTEAQKPARLTQLSEGYLRQGMLTDAAGATGFVRDTYPNDAAVAQAAEVQAVAVLLGEVDREQVVDDALTESDKDYAKVAALVRQEQYEEALEVMDANEGLGTRSAAHRLLLGYLAYRTGDYDRARHELLKAKRLEDALATRAPAVAYYLAKGAYGSGEFVKAAEEMRRYRELSKRLSGSAPQD